MPIAQSAIATAAMLIPTVTPVESPLDSVAAGRGDGDSVSLVVAIGNGGAWVDVAEGVDEAVVVDVVEVVVLVFDVVEEADEAVLVHVAEVAVLVSVSGREEARIQNPSWVTSCEVPWLLTMWSWYGTLQSGAQDATHENESLESEGVFAKHSLVDERKKARNVVRCEPDSLCNWRWELPAPSTGAARLILRT
jgi:hypothetical protein